ncbi:RNA-binding motif, single-stranded-interacting protein 1-like isoform X2 [Acanthaster planci]|uniref:RNA-binding motif, single-stranded-interacting protein 1-like isoform X2 n=1 Tax=Acanthaster planci TaxID=133434 RepID=A0A8B7XJM6_ACAPL|nr:RNA-binding motif, single-stranded-interacting protein 1-like isoform X2 [Acanthaster planci]
MSNPPQGHQHHSQPTSPSSSAAPTSSHEGLVGSPTAPPSSQQPTSVHEGEQPVQSGRVGHNGESTSSPAIVDGAYDSDRGNGIASTGSDDRKLTQQNRSVTVLKSRTSPSLAAAPVTYTVRPIPQHHLSQQQQRIPYIAKRAMSPQTHHPIVWQNQAAVAAAAAASQGWTQFFPRPAVVPQGVPQSVSPHGAPRYQPQPAPQPYPAYTSHTPPTGTYPPVRTMPPPSPASNTGSAGSSGSSSQQHSPHSQSSQSSYGNDKLSKTNLYIRGLPTHTTDENLVSLCQHYGKIISTKAIMDKQTNKCKGYGFVDFDSAAAAQKAVVALQSQGILAQMAKQQEQDPTNLYISNLPKSYDEKELENMLSPYGHVISTRILRDSQTQLSRGVGFARMESKEKCEEVIKRFNGYIVPGQHDPLLCKFADGGVKKRNQFNKQQQTTTPTIWTAQRPDQGQLSYDSAVYQRNGHNLSNAVVTQMVPAPFVGSQQIGYSVQPSNPGWMTQAATPYIVPQQHLTPVSSHMGTSIITQSPTMEQPLTVPNTGMMPQIAQQMSHLQLQPYMHAGSYVGQQAYQHGTTMLQPVAVEDVSGVTVQAPDASPHTSNQSSPQEQVEDVHGQGQPQQYYAAAPVVTAHAK